MVLRLSSLEDEQVVTQGIIEVDARWQRNGSLRHH